MKTPPTRSFDAWGVAVHGRYRGAGSILRGNSKVPAIYPTRAKARSAARIERCLGLAATAIRVRVTIAAMQPAREAGEE